MKGIEQEIITDIHRWGLHNTSRGRQSILESLATLQHFGAPTRLIDVTFNAYTGLWFAVEEKYNDHGERAYEDTDGRIFAIDVTQRLINEIDSLRSWEDRRKRPWSRLSNNQWCTQAFAWRPPPFEARIAA